MPECCAEEVESVQFLADVVSKPRKCHVSGVQTFARHSFVLVFPAFLPLYLLANFFSWLANLFSVMGQIAAVDRVSLKEDVYGLMLLPSRFHHVWLFATSCTVAHQVPLSMGFLRQECGMGFYALLHRIFLTRDQTRVSYIFCFGRLALYHWHHLGSPWMPMDLC